MNPGWKLNLILEEEDGNEVAFKGEELAAIVEVLLFGLENNMEASSVFNTFKFLDEGGNTKYLRIEIANDKEKLSN